MKNVWNRFKAYMNIIADPEIARTENTRTLKTILLIGFLNSLLLIVLEMAVHGQIHYGYLVGSGIFLFFMAFSFMNWPDLKHGITLEMELVILGILLFFAFIDYLPATQQSSFLFLILLVLLPSLIFDRPWKLLLLILSAGLCALIINGRILDEAVRGENIIRIISVTFLAGVFSSYYAYARIRSVHMRQSTQVVAEHDPLTGIYNRAGGIQLIRDCISRQESGTFLIIDIDDFKMVNDQYGHQKGDDVLKEVSAVLQASFKQRDIVMRMGGDEFIVYASGMVDYEVSRKRLAQLNEAIHHVIVSEQDGVHVTVSIGGAINDGSYPTYESLYKTADQYLYQTKARGKDGYSLLGTSYTASESRG